MHKWPREGAGPSCAKMSAGCWVLPGFTSLTEVCKPLYSRKELKCETLGNPSGLICISMFFFDL